jgi:hypothetical protein
MPHARTYEPSTPKAHLIDELEDLHDELDQRNAELELARTQAQSWRAIALALARTLRARPLNDLDLVEVNTTLAIR